MPAPDNRPRILIVEDDPINAEALAATLRDNCHTVWAPDGEKALVMARSEPLPDLILLDIVMPKKNGFEVCKELKANPVTANIPVIFVTAMTDDLNEALGLGFGAVDYIYKPINPVLVRARVAIHIRLKMQNDFLMRLVEKRTQDLEAASREARALLRS